MSDLANPYSAPQATISTGPLEAVSGGITEKTASLVSKAGPWATFLGVMGFIGTGFIVLVAIASVFAAGLLTSGLTTVMPFLKGLGGATGGILGLIYVVIAAFAFFPSLFMVNIGSAAKRFRLRGDSKDIEQFVAAFKKWVKFYGVTLIVFMSIYAVVIVVGIIVAVAASAR